jgi:signal transduction histidine kinase
MVFANLISNGLKFNESPQPWVEIGTSRSRALTIYVRDNGIGIPREHHQTIFALFRRLHSRKRYSGTGAGLAIVRKIVESYGGRVWVESEPGRGSSFYFSLGPAPPAAAAVRPDPAQTRKPAAKPPHWSRPRKAASARRIA